jgi:osmotically-inducible protein OsmY
VAQRCDACNFARVKKALEANAEIAQGVDVSAKDGKVRLWGTVPSRAARRAAEKMAAATPASAAWRTRSW